MRLLERRSRSCLGSGAMNRLIRTKLVGTDRLRLAVYFVVGSLAGLVTMARVLEDATWPSWTSVMLFGTAGLVVHNVVFVLPTGVRLMPGTPVIITGLYCFGLPLALLTVLPSFLVHFVTKRNGLLNSLFNIGQLALSVIAAASVGGAMGWAPGVNLGTKALVVLPVMVFVQELVNYGLVAQAIALEHKKPFIPWLKRIGFEDRAYAIPTVYSSSIVSALLVHYMGYGGAAVALMAVFAIFAQSRLLKECATKAEESRTDALTGLHNLRYLEDQLDRGLNFNHTDSVVSILFVDVDGLKSINDTFGHAAGDSVLIQIGAYLVGKVGKDNVMRYGGDEFVLLCHGTDTSSAVKFAMCTLDELQESPPIYNGIPIKCGLSYGIATFPVHSTTGRELVRLADRAMYLAKKGGGNTVYVADTV